MSVFYGSYDGYKGYTKPTLKEKHIKRLDREFWQPSACTRESSVLEIGCGTGLFLAYLAEKGLKDFVGIDIDAALSDYLPQTVTDHVEIIDVRQYLEREANRRTFDCIALFDVLEHFTPEEGLALLQSFKKVLSPGGRAVLKVPNISSPWGAQFQYGDLTHRAAYTPLSMRQLATAAGYECLACYPHYLGSPMRRALDGMFHGILSRVLMTPPQIWSANFFSVLRWPGP